MLEGMSEWGHHRALPKNAESGHRVDRNRRPIMVPWVYWWHRFVLRHPMAGPQELGQVDIWHDEVCGRPFHMLARMPDEPRP
jgi:hypothetical protein